LKLKVFYHVVDLPGWKSIVDEQLGKMRDSGLLDNCDLYMSLHYNESSFDQLKTEYSNYKNIHWIFRDAAKEEYEYPTAMLMQETAIATREEFYALYLHLKGITFLNTPNETTTKHWRWLMDYWNIEKWRDCVAKLDEGYETVGCLQLPQPIQHFSGNVHWARASFIRRCSRLKMPSTVGFIKQVDQPYNYRHDVETWYGFNKAKSYSFYNDPLDHYWQECPPEVYR
jgi:hypothetical protein